MPNVMFLGYTRQETKLISFVEDQGWTVENTVDMIADLSLFELTISFGYRHIIKPATLATAKRPIINLHIGYLPWNRGAHPLFWAVYDGTPVGVTIHEIDSGIDTGPICFQKLIHVDQEQETFASAHKRLVAELEDLFVLHARELLSGRYRTQKQAAGGTFRRVRDLPAGVAWSEVIGPLIRTIKRPEDV